MKQDALVTESELLATLTAEHQKLDARLRELERQVSMTSAERDEYTLLKKQKLRTKDRIARITARA